MNASQTLGQHLSQQQRLSPQLQQSLNILQAPVFELRQMIGQELSQNPVLEVEDPEVSVEAERAEAELEDDGFDKEFEKLSQMDEEWRTYLQQSASGQTPRTAEDEERRQFMFDSLTAQVTLADHLTQQLALVECTPETRRIVEMLIGGLDEKGFLAMPLGDMSLEYGIPLADLEEASGILQTFDPPGVGAADLRECLLIQLARQGRAHSLESRVVSAHFDDLARHRFPFIAKRLGVEPPDISKALEIIGRLNPRPAGNFSPDTRQFVQADVRVERQGRKYIVAMDESQLPRLRISNLYKDIMANPRGTRDARDYIRDKIRSGKFLIRSIHQRQETIRRIAEEIVARQQDFFREGPSGMKPMIMSQVADAVGVHETTVSRAIAGKYISTPHGLFELRYFFTAGLATEDGEATSNTSVKSLITGIISEEDPSSPLSDDDIAKVLVARGIKIARRTVAKYREAENILPSHLRRKF
jgi:RNA polymerase sigma-54 factor